MQTEVRKKKMVNFRIPIELDNKFTRISKEVGMSKTRIVKDYIREFCSGNTQIKNSCSE